jgi:hypothetical protein
MCQPSRPFGDCATSGRLSQWQRRPTGPMAVGRAAAIQSAKPRTAAGESLRRLQMRQPGLMGGHLHSAQGDTQNKTTKALATILATAKIPLHFFLFLFWKFNNSFQNFRRIVDAMTVPANQVFLSGMLLASQRKGFDDNEHHLQTSC